MAKSSLSLLALGIVLATILGCLASHWPPANTVSSREEVIFWHFWGGEDRAVVERLIERFNQSQDRYLVRGVAMPGNNFDLKVFLAIAGKNPPDVLNHDDPIVADWAARGAIQPLRSLCTKEEYRALTDALLLPAIRLGEYRAELFALCNGLDIRALYYNQSLLDKHRLHPPASLEELDVLAETIAPPTKERLERYGFLPDARRLWSWAPAFGGGFRVDEQGRAVINTPENAAALRWMKSYRDRYGGDNLAAFRQADQSLPGKTFPLLSERYAIVLDGQWRVRDIRAAQRREREQGKPVTTYGICPVPPPEGGVPLAGWVNGNIFVVPTGARNPAGAWAFMQFWIGLGSHVDDAARICEEGGWIPSLRTTVESPRFRDYLKREPLFQTFVELAASPHQYPVPLVPGGAFYQREVERLGEQLLRDAETRTADDLLRAAEISINAQLRRQSRQDGP